LGRTAAEAAEAAAAGTEEAAVEAEAAAAEEEEEKEAKQMRIIGRTRRGKARGSMAEEASEHAQQSERVATHRGA
jgi:hypothetical protein